MKAALKVVEPEAGKDAVVSVTADGFPILKGTESTHAACGHCGAVLAWNASPDTIRGMFTTVHRMTVRCDCGHHNLISGTSYLASRLQATFAVPADESFEQLLIRLSDDGPGVAAAWTR